LAYQPLGSSTFLSEQISHQQSANNTFLFEQISISHQPNETHCALLTKEKSKAVYQPLDRGLICSPSKA
jgi:hypothetical protein